MNKSDFDFTTLPVGARLKTRDNCNARILATDLRDEDYALVVAVADSDGDEELWKMSAMGKVHPYGVSHNHDLRPPLTPPRPGYELIAENGALRVWSDGTDDPEISICINDEELLLLEIDCGMSQGLGYVEKIRNITGKVR